MSDRQTKIRIRRSIRQADDAKIIRQSFRHADKAKITDVQTSGDPRTKITAGQRQGLENFTRAKRSQSVRNIL